jgi:cell division protein FtsW
MASPLPRKTGHRPDYFLLAVIFLLTTAGLVILASASSDLGKIRFGDSYYYLKHQLATGLALGAIGFFLAYKIHYQSYRKLSILFLLVNIVFLVMIFTQFGVTAGGASRWLRLGPLMFQPAELLKLTFLIYIAAWLTNTKMNRVRNFMTGALPFFIICGIVATLLFFQPATSTVVILMVAGLIMYFVSGVPMKYIGIFCFVGVLAVGILIWRTPYRLERVLGYLNPTRDLQGSGYQRKQATMAIGSGQLWGMGYGQSPSKVNYLPAPLDDSIFAIAAQELGFVGSAGLVILFAILIFRMLWIARRARDGFGHLILVGFASIIALQALVNMGSISGLIPLTGIPLPFVSYGGTALAVFLTMGGVAGNISKYT